MRQKITGPEFFIGRGSNSLAPGGKELISFGSGQPDLPPPKEAFDILKKYKGFKYGLVQGDEALREALAKKYSGTKKDEYVITAGASEAIDLALRAIAPSSREKIGNVLLPRPYYYSYPRNVELAGMKPVFSDLDSGGKIDFEDFSKRVRSCRGVIVNSPSNPTGTVQDVSVLKKIEKITKELGVHVISDAVYKDLVYGKEKYVLKGGHVITVDSFSKTYAMCGFRVGFLHCTDRALVSKIVEMKTHTAMNTSGVGQAVALAALSSPKSYITNYVDIWEQRRDLLHEGLKDLGLELWKPEGAFYVLPKMKHSDKVVSDLYHCYKMIVYDGAWFGASNHIRMSYALDISKIQEGLRRLKTFLATEYLKY